MNCQAAFLIAAIVMAAFGGTARSVQAQDDSVADQYRALVAEFELEGGARLYARQFLALAEEHPEDEAAVDALLWVLDNVKGRPDTTKALELLQTYHLDNEKLGPASFAIANSRSIAAEPLLLRLLNDSQAESVRPQACYALAVLWAREMQIVDQLKSQPELAPRVLQYYGDEYGEHLASLELASLESQLEQLYEQMRESFADVEYLDQTMGEIAEQMLYRMRHLSVGKVAPEIEGEDIFGEVFRLSDYRGKVVMLSFWGHW